MKFFYRYRKLVLTLVFLFGFTLLPASSKAATQATYDFNQLSYVSSYGLTYSVNPGSGALTVNFQGQYKEIKYNLPGNTSLSNCSTIVINARSLTGQKVAVKFYDTSGAEAFVQYNITNTTNQNTTITLSQQQKNQTIRTIGVMSQDVANYTAVVNSITFNVSGGGTDPDPSGPLVALTFDDGPSATTTNVLNKLQTYDVTASFFVIGNNINTGTTGIIQRAFNMGCEINNHSLTHQDMSRFTASQVINEITTTNTRVQNAVGVSPGFFRAPYVSTSQTLLNSANMPFIQGVMCNDWDNAYNAAYRAQNTLNQVNDGTIVLLHDFAGNQMTVDALDTIIPTLINRGYQFVTVSELFSLKGVTPQNGVIYSRVQ